MLIYWRLIHTLFLFKPYLHVTQIIQVMDDHCGIESHCDLEIPYDLRNPL